MTAMEPELATTVAEGSRSAAWRLAVPALLLLALGVAAVVYGSLRLPWPLPWPWEAGGLKRFAATLAVLAFAVAAVTRAARLRPAPAAASVAGLVIVASGHAGALLLVLAFALAAHIVGRRMRRAWGDGNDEPALDVLLGAGALGTVASLLAHRPLLRDATCTLLIALPIVLDHRAARDALSTLAAAARGRDRDRVALAAAVLGALYGVVALFPEVGWDALAVHLFIPAHVDAHAMWTFDATRYAWALMPTLVDFVYAIVYVPGGGEVAARLTNVGALILVAALVARLAREAGGAARWCNFAALLFLATPLAFALGASLFIDAAWTAFIVGAVLALAGAQRDASPFARWITAGVLLGFAAAAKAVTLPMLAVFGLVFVAQAIASRSPDAVRALTLTGAGFLLAAAKPYATAWLFTGNPVYPFYVHLFGGPPFDYWTSGPQHFAAPLDWRTPYDITFHTTRYFEGRPGAPGLQWVVLLPAALVALAVTRSWRGLALAVVGIALAIVVFVFSSYLRYVVPAFALLCAAIAVAGSALAQRTPAASRAFAAAGALTIAANLVVLSAASHHGAFPLRALLGEHEREEVRAAGSPAAAAGAIAGQLARGHPIAYFANPTFAVSPASSMLHPSWYTPAFHRAVGTAATPQALADVLLDADAPLVVLEPAFMRNERLLPLVARVTRPLVEGAHASVREVRDEYVFPHELVRDTELVSGDGWTLAGEARRDAARGTFVVSAPSPAYQPLPARPRARYLNTVRARCETGRRFRLQVNWLDARQQLVAVALQEVDCGPEWREQSQSIVAPEGAALAIVYASGAGPEFVEIDRVSLRGRRR